MKAKFRSFSKKANFEFQILAVGGITGAFVGVLVTLYNALATLAEEFSRGYYGFFRDHPAFIPLLFLGLFLGAIVVGGVVRFLPIVRESGLPQTEGAARGLLRFRWYEALTGMFALSLFIIFTGGSAGAEGPSIFIGGSCGYGVSNTLHRNPVVRRYQITGGASAGLAVACNAPLTGIAFALEEAHKRFTPEVFVCSFSSVIVAVVIRNLLRPAMGLSVEASLPAFSFAGDLGLMFCLYALFAAFFTALAGVGFYFLLFWLRKLFARAVFWKGMGKFIAPFLLAGAAGLLTVNVMGGGHFFLESLAGGEVTPLFSSPIWVTLLVAALLKFLLTAVNMGAGMPCGAFIPMLATGAGMGGLLSILCVHMGMDPALADMVIVVCMATFFTTVVKAPITATVMTLELTWNFAFLLPVVIGVATGYVLGDLFRTEPVYDRILDEVLEEKKNAAKLTAKVRVTGRAAGRAVRDILWPFSALVVKVERGAETLVPKGSTELREGDLLYVEGTPDEREEYLAELRAVAGDVLFAEEETKDEQEIEDGKDKQDTQDKQDGRDDPPA